jgi:hypothetical protein
MAKQIKIIDDDKLTLVFHPNEKIVHHQIHKPLDDDEIKAMLTQGCEVFEVNGAEKWLSDDRGNGPVSQEIERWGQEVWNKRMVAAGWKYWALVIPEEALKEATSTMKMIIFNLSKLGVTLRLFSDPDRAMDWLKNQ